MRRLFLKFASIVTLAAAASVMSIGPASADDPSVCVCYSACAAQTTACHSSCTWNQACHNQCTAIFNQCMAACG